MSGSAYSMPPNTKYPFWFGGSAACMATCVTHPLELVKVRLQTSIHGSPKTMTGTFFRIVHTTGFRSLYNGISASLLRQITYSTVRFGIYEDLKQRSGSDPSAAFLAAIAASSGFIGGLAGNVADVVNVRMQNDTALPEAQRRNYKHAIDGIICLTKEEGFRGWFKGWLPNSSRAAVTTVAQLASYDVVKRFLIRNTGMEDEVPTQILASCMAGAMAATVASPMDVIKTKVMMSTGNQGLLKILREVIRTGGATWMFQGWVPSFLRQGPHTVCIFFFLEMQRKIYRQL